MNSSKLLSADWRRLLLRVVNLQNQPPANGLLIQSRRHVKGVRRIRREHINPYKKDLSNLPRLTEHLTIVETREDLRIPPSGRPLDELWSDKLAVYKEFLPCNQKPVLLEALLNPHNDIDGLLKIIDENLVTMTSFYVAVSFEVIDDVIRAGQCAIETVIVAPEFRRLCTQALYKIRFFEADETLKLIKCLSTIRLPEETLLSQAAFQMARHLINDYNLDELNTLSECLDSFVISDNSKKSLLLALKQAIPAVMKNTIDEKQYDRIEDAKSLSLKGPSRR